MAEEFNNDPKDQLLRALDASDGSAVLAAAAMKTRFLIPSRQQAPAFPAEKPLPEF